MGYNTIQCDAILCDTLRCDTIQVDIILTTVLDYLVQDFSENLTAYWYRRLYVVLFSRIINNYIESVLRQIQQSYANSNTLTGYLGSIMTSGSKSSNSSNSNSSNSNSSSSSSNNINNNNKTNQIPCTLDDESVGRLLQDATTIHKFISSFFNNLKQRRRKIGSDDNSTGRRKRVKKYGYYLYISIL